MIAGGVLRGFSDQYRDRRVEALAPIKGPFSGDRNARGVVGGAMSSLRLFPLLLFTACMIVPAQDRRRTHPDDANGDGRISRSEWRGSAAEFQRLDTNRDGILSGTEIPQNSNTVEDRPGRD